MPDPDIDPIGAPRSQKWGVQAIIDQVVIQLLAVRIQRLPPAEFSTACAAAVSQQDVGPNRAVRSAVPSATMQIFIDDPTPSKV